MSFGDTGQPPWWNTIGEGLGEFWGKVVNDVDEDIDPFTSTARKWQKGIKDLKDHFPGNSQGKTRAGKKYVPKPPDEPPVSNNPRTTKMPSRENLHKKYGGAAHVSGMNNHGTDGDEVPIMPPPRKMSKIHPDYFSLNIPYCFREDEFSLSTFTYDNRTPVMTIRLNSIYDPLKQIRTGTDTENIALNDPVLDSDIHPAGRDIWAAHFKYYRVLGASVKVTFAHNGRADGENDSPFQNTFMFGYELTDEDGQISDQVETFLTTKDAKRDFISQCATTEAYNGTSTQARITKPQFTSFVYKYDPANWKYHVEEKSSEERWTPIKQNPGIDHELNVRLFHMNDQFGPSGNGAVLVQINYQVQFREPIDSFFKAIDGTPAGYTGAGGEPSVDD